MEIDTAQNGYFSSYEDLEIHQLMLEDSPRTHAYKQAILTNKVYFKDKIVMDVGCGTGILSIFCAQAGAKKVYAIEASNISNLAREIVKENNFDDIIEIIHRKVEDVVLPNNIKVDVIVSEWMGFYLLHEGMLDSVLYARDKFLKEGGEIFPEKAAIYVAPCSVPSLYKQWDDLHGVSMRKFSKQLRASKYNKPEILNIQPEHLLCTEVVLGCIDLRKDKISDLDTFSIQHVLGVEKSGMYQGLCVWFECIFPHLSESDQNECSVTLSTGPRSMTTHWKQTVILLPEEQEVDEGEPIAFRLDMTRDKINCRRYNLQLTLLDPDTVDHPLPCTCHMTKCILIKTFMNQYPEQPAEEVAMEDSNILEENNIEDDDIE